MPILHSFLPRLARSRPRQTWLAWLGCHHLLPAVVVALISALIGTLIGANGATVWGDEPVRVTPLDILPDDQAYDPSVPTPKEVLGFDVGERHLLHHELMSYLKRLAEASERVTLREYARTYGGRPLVLLTITSPRNHLRLDRIQRAHLRLTDASRSAGVDVARLPAVINMGYGVHGNESSASNAAPLVAYHLAAGTGTDHEQLLRDVVVLLDPSLNPDGMDRFARWANDHRGLVLNPDPQHREHREPWPNGRTNYYWFDLNRDWVPAQHPESQGRLAVYHQWKPNVVLDFHEMGTDATYFFQPGVPARTNPLTPRRNVELTRLFAQYHAAALDRAGSLYYTEERFDDFYMGKGSTYPDLHGGVGILFEQASSRGHLQDSIHGRLSFPFTIRNHFLTSMSSLQATQRLREELHEHKRTFYGDAETLARNHATEAFVVAAPGDPARLHHFLEVLARHDIRAYRLARTLTADGKSFAAGRAFVVPVAQPEFRFLQDLFARRLEFEESIFYDVSAWTLPLAFGVDVAAIDTALPAAGLGEAFSIDEFPRRAGELDATAVAAVIDWRGYYAPRTLYRLLDEDVRVYVATEPFRATTVGGRVRPFSYGSLLVPLAAQPDRRDDALAILREAAADGVDVHAATSGLTPDGIDFGSSSFRPVAQPKVLAVTGGSAYELGEVWHLLDRRVSMPLTMVDGDRLSGVRLDDYTVVVLVGGSDAGISAAATGNLKDFVRNGGTIVATGSAITWLNSKEIASVEFRKDDESASANDTRRRRPYAAASDDAALELIGGSIFLTHVDHTHPVGYGFAPNARLPVFRNHRVMLEPSRNAYCTPILYDQQPLLSGYVSSKNLARLAGSGSVVVDGTGRGRAIMIAENPNFRAFWYSTNRVFLNSVFFGSIVREPADAGEVDVH